MTAVLSRLFPAASGPASPTPYSGPFTAGVSFRLPGPAIGWLQGYFIWVPAGGDTAPVYTGKLWQGLTSTAGSPVAGSVAATSGPLTAGAWNFIPLAAPVPLALDTPWTAGVGWAVTNGFPDTANQFGSGDPFAAGFTSGNLFAYSDQTGTAALPTGAPQGGFTVTAGPPQFPDSSSNSSNFWVDVLVSDTAPAGAVFELYPSNVNGNLSAVVDLNVNYNVGTEFWLSAACPLNGIKYLSPAGAASLATRASVWAITDGGLLRPEIPATVVAAPSWSGAAGSGFVQVTYPTPPILPPGKYVVAVFNAAGTGGGWNAKDSETGAFGSGGYANGITSGPLSAPALAAASLCYDYSSADGANTPPFAIGTTVPGQCPFGQLPAGTAGQPYLYAGAASGSLPQNYFVSPLIGQPVATAGYSLPAMLAAM